MESPFVGFKRFTGNNNNIYTDFPTFECRFRKSVIMGWFAEDNEIKNRQIVGVSIVIPGSNTDTVIYADCTLEEFDKIMSEDG